ncbi:winged helix-turn-helix transcriptional regulator [Nakamurella endophytica]|uniref:Transcriptional regulator n=1 Tax=Nakamurella endophytica TaxID=1748367 RepID=A0A917WBB3_9ACTN|nr:helix-turn-helix domain-containing protein [Nakamurella endophytica]GGL86629.1 transcriptional regulator [Nakamurella endophytica]
MRRTSFAADECPIARAADGVGDVWGVLVLREMFDGYQRFDELTGRLGIAPNMLSRRLAALVDAGLVERRRYSDRPPRDEYVLTPLGHSYRAVVVALFAVTTAATAPASRPLLLVDRATGREVEPVLVDRATGRALDEVDVEWVAGPGASPGMRARRAEVQRRRAATG